jgi:hypothetical protein
MRRDVGGGDVGMCGRCGDVGMWGGDVVKMW